MAVIAGAAIGTLAAAGIGALIDLFDSSDDEAERQAAAAELARRKAAEEARGIYGEATRWVDQAAQDRPELADLMGRVHLLSGDADLLGESARAGVQADPESIEAQRGALSRLSEYAQGDIMPEDRARMEMARRNQEQMLRGRDLAIHQQMQERGMGGSGSELAARLGAGQGAAQRQSLEDMQMQAMASQRALQAMQAQGDLAGRMRQQGFDEGAYRASAVDQFNMADTEHKRRVAQWNAAARNAYEDVRRGAHQQDWDNRMRGAGAMAGSRRAEADALLGITRDDADRAQQRSDYYQQRDANRMAGWMQMGQGLGGAIGGLAGGGGGGGGGGSRPPGSIYRDWDELGDPEDEPRADYGWYP